VVGCDEEEKMTGLADSEVLADSLIMYVSLNLYGFMKLV